MTEIFKAGDLVETVHNGKVVRLTTDRLPNDHYGATLDIHATWPDGVFGAAVYLHHGALLRKVDESTTDGRPDS